MPQDTLAEIRRKQGLLIEATRVKNMFLQYHDGKTSIMEGVFARGDRRLGQALYLAWQRGQRFDGWSDVFDFDRWQQALADCGLDPDFYNHRARSPQEVFPWEHLQPAVNRAFLAHEYKKAQEAMLTPDCRLGNCNGCGVCQRLGVPIMDGSGRAYDASQEAGFASLAEKMAGCDNESYRAATQRPGLPKERGGA